MAQWAVAVVYAFGRRSFRMGAEHCRDVCRHTEMADGAKGYPGVSVISRYLQKRISQGQCDWIGVCGAFAHIVRELSLFFSQYGLAVLCCNQLHAVCGGIVYHRADVCVSPLCALPAPAAKIYSASAAVWCHAAADDRLYADRVRICPLLAVYAAGIDPILRPVFIWASDDVFCSQRISKDGGSVPPSRLTKK